MGPFRFEFVEEQLNQATKSLNISELITDTVKILHARQMRASENDCLMPRCEKFLQKLTVSDLEMPKISCIDEACNGIKDFYKFLVEAKPFLLPNVAEELYNSFIVRKISLDTSSRDG